jgi:hypothetical protein
MRSHGDHCSSSSFGVFRGWKKEVGRNDVTVTGAGSDKLFGWKALAVAAARGEMFDIH